MKHHRWDYVGNRRIGKSKVIADNKEHATYVCPYCNSVKHIEIEVDGI